MRYQLPAKTGYRLLQLSDCHLLASRDGVYQQIQPWWHLKQLLQQLQSEPFDAVILTGDLTQDHSLASYQRLAELFADWPGPVLYLPGNHDDPALMAQAFAAAPFVAATEITAANWRFILLNTKGETPAGYFPIERCHALAHQLDGDTRLVWLFCHHQPLPIGASIDQHGLQQPELLLSTLARFPQVKGLAHGHCHYHYQRRYADPQQQGSLQLVGCPATSVQFCLTPDWQTEDQGPQGLIWQFSANAEVSWQQVSLSTQSNFQE